MHASIMLEAEPMGTDYSREPELKCGVDFLLEPWHLQHALLTKNSCKEAENPGTLRIPSRVFYSNTEYGVKCQARGGILPFLYVCDGHAVLPAVPHPPLHYTPPRLPCDPWGREQRRKHHTHYTRKGKLPLYLFTV
jgi:hypothetical protein